MTVNRDRQRKLAARERRQAALQRASAQEPQEPKEEEKEGFIDKVKRVLTKRKPKDATTGPEETGTANNEGARRRGRKPKVKES